MKLGRYVLIDLIKTKAISIFFAQTLFMNGEALKIKEIKELQNRTNRT